jgi:hypothetical protein
LSTLPLTADFRALVLQVVQSVADMLIDEILVEAATEVTDVFDSFAEELFEQEFQG